MTAVLCRKASDRSAKTWKSCLEPFAGLEFAVSDGAKVIQSAVAAIVQSRRGQASAPTLEQGLDLFHTAKEARKVLAASWRHVEAKWERAEAAAKKAAHLKWRGQSVLARAKGSAARSAWSSAIAALERCTRLESAWKRARAAFELFTPDGQLNDPTRARAEITAALPGLAGPDWSRVRTYLEDPRSLSFLDRLHRRLEEAEPRRDLREALAWRWWLRHGRPPKASTPATALVRAVARDRQPNDEDRVSQERVSAVLEDTFRASSAVECMNSVLRMQQSRHRRMTQGMLDLERLYWNTHRFGSGPRKDSSPYQAMGMELPTHAFWELLHTDPAALARRLSTQRTSD